VALDSVFDSLLKVLPDDKLDPHLKRLAQANIKARLRMTTLYYFANRFKYLVVGSGNRDELAVGYFTKYGDGGVDILPLGNLLKGQVKELAKFLAVPEPIINKPPSAGLWEGQTDEEELGFSYDELDLYLASGEASAALKKRIESMLAATQHKRQPPPVASF
jgi:NAD+ synthase